MGKKRTFQKEDEEYDEKKEKKKTRTANFAELSWEILLEREKELAKEEKEMGHLLNKVRAQSSYIYGNNEIRQQSTKRLRAEYAHSEVKREIERRTRQMEGNQPNAPVGPSKGGGKGKAPRGTPPAPAAASNQQSEFQKQLLMQASGSSSSSSGAAPGSSAAYDPNLLANRFGVPMPQEEEKETSQEDEPPAVQAFDPALLARRLSGLGGAETHQLTEQHQLTASFLAATAPTFSSALPVAAGPLPVAASPSSLPVAASPLPIAASPLPVAASPLPVARVPGSLAATPVQLRIPQAGQGSVLPVMPVVRPLQIAHVAPALSAPGASNIPAAFRNMRKF